MARIKGDITYMRALVREYLSLPKPRWSRVEIARQLWNHDRHMLPHHRTATAEQIDTMIKQEFKR